VASWKVIVISVLVGTAGIAAGVFFDRSRQERHPAGSEQSSTPTCDAAVAVASTKIPAPPPTQNAVEAAVAAANVAAAAAKLAAGDSDTDLPRRVFADLPVDPQEGFYMDRFGECYGVYGRTPADMASYLEARLGSRIFGFDWFNDGLIVIFRNGNRVPVWQKEIDCKDPPYDPLATK